ncbi:MAG: helix-turn-helix domain-containing protein [Defluviitaleaceae bacterium]|nr:helix-turn-helix domain-containing protein [Defluviitaleaceae bacterium]
MKENSEAEIKLIIEFSKLGGNLNPKAEEILKKKINKYLKDNGEADAILLDVLRLLKIYKIEREFSELGLLHKISETSKIAIPIVERLMLTSIEKWSFYDIFIAQIVCSFTQSFEEAEELTKKAFIALKNFEKEKPVNKIKFYFHANNTYRLLKAKFFEIESSKEQERSESLKNLFNHHLENSLKILKNLNDEELKFWEHTLNIRVAIMEKSSNKVVQHMRLLKAMKKYNKSYEIIRDEVAEYSFHPGFGELAEEHFNIMVGSNIRKLRTKLEVKADDIEDFLGFKENYFNKIERGEQGLSNYNTAKLARFFNITTDELIYGKR